MSRDAVLRQDAAQDIPVLTADALYELIAEACEHFAFWDEYSFPRIVRSALKERGDGVFVVEDRFDQDAIYALKVVMRRVCDCLHSQVRYCFDNRYEYGLPYIVFAWVICVGDADDFDRRATV